MSDLSVALLGGGGAMLGWGAADFFAKKTIDVIGDLRTLFWGQVVGTVALAFACLAGTTALPGSGSLLSTLLAFGLVSGWSYLLLYRGFAQGQVSVLSPIFASYAGVAALLAALVYSEPLPTLAKVGLPVCFAGILLMSTDVSGLRGITERRGLGGGVTETLLAMLVFAGWLVLWDHFLADRDWLPMTTVMRGFAVVGLVVAAAVMKQGLTVSDRALYPFLAAVGLCDVGAYSALSYGFAHSELGSVVALLSGAFSLPTLILARIFLQEKLMWLQGVEAAVIISGIALVALA